MQSTTLTSDLPDWVSDWAPCLKHGPLAQAGRSLVRASFALPKGYEASMLRAWAVHKTFSTCETLYRSEHSPIPQFVSFLSQLTEWFSLSAKLGLIELHRESVAPRNVEEITGSHYGELFKRFDEDSYWKEPAEVLSQRFERNGISRSCYEGLRVLDAGCGGGRYSAAWATLGAGEVVGVDISEVGIADARRRMAEAGISNVRFEIGSALALPFADSSFDVAFSNGVLHHSTDWQKGISELVRVLKPGGFGWLYLIEDPGGLHWDSIEILRVIMRSEPREAARECLRALGVPPNRIFYMLDHVMAPINIRLKREQIEQALEASGALQIRRLDRGCRYDRTEYIHEGSPFAFEKFGLGEHRFVFSK